MKNRLCTTKEAVLTEVAWLFAYQYTSGEEGICKGRMVRPLAGLLSGLGLGVLFISSDTPESVLSRQY
jgi:hypothetical protein